MREQFIKKTQKGVWWTRLPSDQPTRKQTRSALYRYQTPDVRYQHMDFAPAEIDLHGLASDIRHSDIRLHALYCQRNSLKVKKS